MPDLLIRPTNPARAGASSRDTYTAGRPDSSEMYANSGAEGDPWGSISLAAVATNGSASGGRDRVHAAAAGGEHATAILSPGDSAHVGEFLARVAEGDRTSPIGGDCPQTMARLEAVGRPACTASPVGPFEWA